MSDSVWPHRQQPIRLCRPWDSLGKNTGVGCHFLLQCMKVKSESEVAQSCPTLSDPMECSPPGSAIHGSSRQEYWSGLPLPSHIAHLIYPVFSDHRLLPLLIVFYFFPTHIPIYTLLSRKGFLHLLECIDPLLMITFVHALGSIFLKCFSHSFSLFFFLIMNFIEV